jgi:hypothetical protein
MIQAHGAKYATKAEAEARIAELNELNLQLGASDGRVTEIQAIIDVLVLVDWESTPAKDLIAEYRAECKSGHFTKASEMGLTVGSPVVGVFTAWGNEHMWTGTVTAIHPAVVSVRYDTPFTLEGPYCGDWREYTGGGYFPGQLRHA